VPVRRRADDAYADDDRSPDAEPGGCRERQMRRHRQRDGPADAARDDGSGEQGGETEQRVERQRAELRPQSGSSRSGVASV
jgi:hypothetical protein